MHQLERCAKGPYQACRRALLCVCRSWLSILLAVYLLFTTYLFICLLYRLIPAVDDGAFEKPCKHTLGKHPYVMQFVNLGITLPVAFWLLTVVRTKHTQMAAFVALITWNYRTVGPFVSLVLCRRAADIELFGQFSVIEACYQMAMLNTDLTICFSLLMIWGRMDALRAASLQSAGARMVRFCSIFALLPSALTVSIKILEYEMSKTALGPLKLFRHSLRLFNTFFILAAILVVLLKPYLLVRRAAVCAPADVASDTQRAVRKIRQQAVAMIILLVSTAWFNAYSMLAWSKPVRKALMEFNSEQYIIGTVVFMFDTLGNTYGSVVLSGALAGGAASAKRRRAKLAQRRRKRAAVHKKLQAASETTQERQWDAKVQDLGKRGITLSALLDFYISLPTRMPHFDPALSTTEDVVRGAIIPMSRDEQCCGADVIMRGQRRVPDKMVTHNWANLFRDLVAGIVASALGEHSWSRVAVMLMEDPDCLVRWVEQYGIGSQAYWVCAFAVNQHRSICSGNPANKVDSATGKPYKLCDCGAEKHWNHTKPTLADGRSIPCEINKFDDMMRECSQRDPNFGQVLCVDARFDVFSRAWCVAEVAAADEMGMPQQLAIRSEETLAQREEQLRSMRIEDMHASRPEDKQQILDSIPDKAAFNSAVQDLLFNDLFPDWGSLDTEEQMGHVGRIIRWHGTASWTVAAPPLAPPKPLPLAPEATKGPPPSSKGVEGIMEKQKTPESQSEETTLTTEASETKQEQLLPAEVKDVVVEVSSGAQNEKPHPVQRELMSL